MLFSPLLLLLLPKLTLASDQLTFSTPSRPHLADEQHRRFDSHRLFKLSDRTSLPSPAFGVGSVWKGQNVTEIVLSALKVGYRHLDNAAFYNTSQYVAEAINLSGLDREQLYITSKYDHLNNRSATDELHFTLKQLNTSYLDLYLIHFPQAAVSLAETWSEFESFVASGLVKSIGVSNFRLSHLQQVYALPELRIEPSVNQIASHLYNQIEIKDTIEFCRKKGIQIAAYSALTSLTTRHGGAVDHTVEKIANKMGLTEGQVIMKWADQKNWAVVTTSGKEFRQQEQLHVFAKDFPRLSQKSIKKLEKKGRQQERKDHDQ